MRQYVVVIDVDDSVDAHALGEFLDAMPMVCAEDCPSGWTLRKVAELSPWSARRGPQDA